MHNNCSADSRQLSPHVRESKTVLESGFRTVDSGFQVLDSSICQENLDSGFQNLARISDSISKLFPDSGFHKEKFPRFRNLDSLTWSEHLGWFPNQLPQLPPKKFIWEFNLRRICSRWNDDILMTWCLSVYWFLVFSTKIVISFKI